MSDVKIHNIHIHAFKNKAVPRKLFGGLSRFFYKYSKIRGFIRILYKINPFKKMNIFERFANYATLGSKSTKAILQHVFEFYPDDTTFGVLAMDMAFMGAGSVTQPYYKQLEKLSAEVGKYSQTILPFICVDPRRKNKGKNLQINDQGDKKESLLNFIDYWIKEKGFAGIKLYPPLGYFPWDEQLIPIYEYAAMKKIPIIAHCAPGVINSKESKRALRKRILEHRDVLEKHGILEENENLRWISRRKLCSYFTHPKNYEILMEKLGIPKKSEEQANVKKPHICLAHFGGDSEVDKYLNPKPGESAKENWFYYIRKLLEKYDNMYADISFTWGIEAYDSLLKVVLLEDEKIHTQVLFGSDFYMNQINYSERNFGLRVRANIGERNFKLIAEDNPKTFLYK